MMKALFSLTDKAGSEQLAKFLLRCGFEIWATSGTAAYLQKHGVECRRTEEVTGFSDLLGGKVKTLHPLIHASILATSQEIDQLEKFGIAPFDVVVVNLYKIESDPSSIDIGGVALLRAAAKNYKRVVVLSDPSQYEDFMKRWPEKIDESYRRALAARAFMLTSWYDSQIVKKIFEQDLKVVFLQKAMDMRYGENPHQKACYYTPDGSAPFIKLQGKELSYNNLLDIEAALLATAQFSEPFAVIIKHGTPCGAAVGSSLAEAYRRALECDPVSAFGGIVGLSFPCDVKTAQEIVKEFKEVVVAPDFAQEALEVLSQKKNLRVVKIDAPADFLKKEWVRSCLGGILFQDSLLTDDVEENWETVCGNPTVQHLNDCRFAWKIVTVVKSNGIVVAKDGQAVGIGGGFTSRVDAARFALKMAGEKARGAVLASDGFLPFPDTVEEAAKYRVAGIVQPGGSIRDAQVIEAARRAGMFMIFTKRRCFRH